MITNAQTGLRVNGKSYQAVKLKLFVSVCSLSLESANLTVTVTATVNSPLPLNHNGKAMLGTQIIRKIFKKLFAE